MWRCRSLKLLSLESFRVTIWRSTSATGAIKCARNIQGSACLAWRTILVALEGVISNISDLDPSTFTLGTCSGKGTRERETGIEPTLTFLIEHESHAFRSLTLPSLGEVVAAPPGADPSLGLVTAEEPLDVGMRGMSSW